MEKKVDSSIREADAAENKLELMEAIIKKLKVGSEEIYLGSKCGATPVLSLLGAAREKEIARPFINENNIVMYLDMVRLSVKYLEVKMDNKNLSSDWPSQHLCPFSKA